MDRQIRLRVVASKEDNPWLREDITVREGLCIKLAPGVSFADIDWDAEMASAIQNSARLIVKTLRRHAAEVVNDAWT